MIVYLIRIIRRCSPKTPLPQRVENAANTLGTLCAAAVQPFKFSFSAGRPATESWLSLVVP